MQDVKLELSLRFMLIAFGGIILLWLLFQIKEVIIILIFAYILMSALNPWVEKMEKSMPRMLAITLLYLAMVLIFSLLLLLVIPVMVNQLGSFIRNIPLLIDQWVHNLNQSTNQTFQLNSQNIGSLINNQLSGFSSNILNFTSGIVGAITSAIFIGVISFYVLLEHRSLEKRFLNFFSIDTQERIFNLIQRIESKLGAWLRGEVMLCLVIGTLSWIGLTIIGVDFALPLAIIAGLMEFIPSLGPTIAAVPAIAIALLSSPLQGILTAVWYILIQQMENSFIVPKVMSSAVNLNPLVVLLAILVGGKLMGVMGILLSVPLLAVAVTIIDDLREHKTNLTA